jgi:hypothetical protein
MDAPLAATAGSAGDLDRLRQLRTLSLGLAQASTLEALVDVLSIRVALDCGAETSVVYLMDPDQPDVLRLAAARAVSDAGVDPSLLCRDGGALIARAVRRQQPQVSLERDPGGSLVTVVASPLLLRTESLGAFAYGFRGVFNLAGANREFLLGASALVSLALDRTAATEKAREAQQVSDYMTSVVTRIFGGQHNSAAC